MIFAGRKKCKTHSIKICIQNKQIDKVTFSVSRLDDKLLFRDDIGLVCNKFTNCLGILRGIRYYVHFSVITTLYSLFLNLSVSFLF